MWGPLLFKKKFSGIFTELATRPIQYISCSVSETLSIHIIYRFFMISSNISTVVLSIFSFFFLNWQLQKEKKSFGQSVNCHLRNEAKKLKKNMQQFFNHFQEVLEENYRMMRRESLLRHNIVNCNTSLWLWLWFLITQAHIVRKGAVKEILDISLADKDS